MHLSNLTISKAHELLRTKQISSVELTKYYLDRIERYNPTLNAYITVNEKALHDAARADERIHRGEALGVLDGIPIAVKDLIMTQGLKTTAASKILENYLPPYSATVVNKLESAGAIILGKTNLDEFAMGSSNETSHFGKVLNPWNTNRVPGGSSGGSAAAVAADLCVAALGTDTAGSIRQPASFCGVCGLLPTYGAVSRYGMIAMTSSLDQIGPMTRSVGDAKIIYDIISGYDAKDSTSVEIRDEKIENRKLKIGIAPEYFGEGVDTIIAEKIKEIIEKIKNEGFEVQAVKIPNLKYALPVYYLIMPVEVSSNLSRYDGIRFGLAAGKSKIENRESSLIDSYYNTRTEGLGNEVKRRIILGAFASSKGYFDAYYNKAKKVQKKIVADFDHVFSDVDLLIAPTTPEIAFGFGEKSADPVKMYLSDILTVPANIAGLPAISIPAGLVNDMPIGLQLIGARFSENKIFEFGSYLERELKWASEPKKEN